MDCLYSKKVFLQKKNTEDSIIVASRGQDRSCLKGCADRTVRPSQAKYKNHEHDY